MANHEVLSSAKSKKPRFFYGYVVVALAFLITVVLGGSTNTFAVFFKPLSGEFGWTRGATSAAFSLYAVLHGLFYIVAGRLNDKFGPRLVITGCGFFLGLGYLLMSQIGAIWHLYLFYGVVIAIGMSGFVPLMSTVARWFVKRRGLMTGIAISGVSAGTMIMPPAASWLISNYGWRTSYAVIGITALVVIISAAQFLRRATGQMRQLPYGQNGVQEESSSLEVAGFSLKEAIRTRQFWLFCIAYFVFGVFQQTILVHIVPHSTDLGISAMAAANIFIAIGGLGLIGRVVMGSASDRIGNKLVLIICFILMVVALLWLLIAKEIWMLYLFGVIFGFAYGGIVTVESPLVAELFGMSSHGVLYGVTRFMVTFGNGVGPVMAGYIFDITGSYNPAFVIGAILSITGLILVSLLKPVKRGEGQNESGRSA